MILLPLQQLLLQLLQLQVSVLPIADQLEKQKTSLAPIAILLQTSMLLLLLLFYTISNPEASEDHLGSQWALNSRFHGNTAEPGLSPPSVVFAQVVFAASAKTGLPRSSWISARPI